MLISLPALILAAGLFVALLAGCIVFLQIGMRYRREYDKEFAANMELKEALANSASDAVAAHSQGDDAEGDNVEDINALQEKIQALETALAEQGQGSEADKVVDKATDVLLDDDPNRVSKLRLDKLNEKYENLQTLWEGTNQELIRADAKVAELLGAKTALEKERDILQRQLSNMSEAVEFSDADSMREIIVNFTEDSRELLNVIEQMGVEKAELEQKIKDMESGGKGSAGAVVGLKRKLAEAEAIIQDLQSSRAG